MKTDSVGETAGPRLRIGLTGGIASGKTTVANLFAELGAEVIDTDIIARELVEPRQPALDSIVHSFGAGILGKDGALDRAALRQLVFADTSARRRLESILHPLIGERMLRLAAMSDRPYVLFVVPLLIEAGMRGLVDRVLVVDCPVDVQLARLLARDGETEQQAKRILAAQIDRGERLAAADDVIANNGDIAALVVAVRRQHAKYLSLADV